jgi:hypothetical protein
MLNAFQKDKASTRSLSGGVKKYRGDLETNNSDRRSELAGQFVVRATDRSKMNTAVVRGA